MLPSLRECVHACRLINLQNVAAAAGLVHKGLESLVRRQEGEGSVFGKADREDVWLDRRRSVWKGGMG